MIKAAESLEDKVKEKTTSLVDINERLRLALEKAESASRLKNEFLANMSHEIRTPLNGVIGFTEILLDTELDASQVEYVETIRRSGESLLTIINDILDFAKIEAGHLEFEAIDFDPELLVYDVCELIAPRVIEKPIEVLCFVADNVPSYVNGDPTRFKQVLTNLFGNAPKFTEKGEIELSLFTEEETQNKIKLHVIVRDTGIGIPENKLRSIFNAFEQADGSITRRYGGTGLGLSICKKISEKMEGDVWIDSIVNQGSTFHFTAWLGKVDNKTVKKHDPVALSGKTVLIVDDNLTNLEILSHNLKTVGANTIALERPVEVLPCLENSLQRPDPIDICLTDIQMPEISGYQLVRQIRDAKQPFSSIPLIALSSSAGNERKRCEEAGFTGFISKPVRKEKLHQMMIRVLSKQKGSEEKPVIQTQYSVREAVKHNIRILLAEDNHTNQKLANIMLSKAGYHVELANDGLEAVEKFLSAPDDFDLIFMDVQMPKLDGKEATRMIRTHGYNAILIVAMTAEAMKGARESCLEAGMNDYISKPLCRKAVFDILDKWILSKT